MMMEQYGEAATLLEETIKLFTRNSITRGSPCLHLNLATAYLHLKNLEKVSDD